MFRNYKYSGLTAYNTSGYFTTDSANTFALNNINFNSNDWNSTSGNINSYDAIISYLSVESLGTITMSLSGSGFITTYTLNSLTKTTSGLTTYYSAIVSGPTGNNTTLLNNSNYDIYFDLSVTRQFTECCEPNESYLGTYTGNTNGSGGSVIYLSGGTIISSQIKGCGEVVTYSGVGTTYNLGNLVSYNTCVLCTGETPCNPVYQMSACSSPYEVFVLRQNIATLTTGETYGIVTESFNGCATVVEYSGTGLIYSASSLTEYADCLTCEGAISPTPTPTPTVTPTLSPTVTPTNTVTPSITPSITPSPTVTPSSVFCNCISYTVTNTNDDEYVSVGYIDCYGNDQLITLGPQQIFDICACNDSIIAPSSVTIINLGSCYGTTPTPTPTIPINPTPTPTPVISDCPNDYCLTINLPEYSNYSGNYTSYGTYNGREYYVGSVSGVVFYNGVSWCLSDSLIGDCILFGKTPCFSNCPDIDENLWTEGICPTPTPSPVIPCLDVSFEAIFDCETTPTQTPTPSITPTPTPTPSTYINPCATVDANITINEILTPTPTPTPTQSPTVQRNVNVSGVTTFTIIDTEFSCNFVRQITECVSGQVYYVSQSMRTTGGTIVETGQTISANVSGETYCYTYNGRVDNQSPTLTLNSILDVYSNCEDCYTNVGGYLITESGDYLLTEDEDYLIY